MRQELLEACEASREDPTVPLPHPDFKFDAIKVIFSCQSCDAFLQTCISPIDSHFGNVSIGLAILSLNLSMPIDAESLCQC